MLLARVKLEREQSADCRHKDPLARGTESDSSRQWTVMESDRLISAGNASVLQACFEKECLVVDEAKVDRSPLCSLLCSPLPTSQRGCSWKGIELAVTFGSPSKMDPEVNRKSFQWDMDAQSMEDSIPMKQCPPAHGSWLTAHSARTHSQYGV